MKTYVKLQMKVVVFLFYSALPGRDSCAGDSGSGLMMDVELPARPYDPRWIQASFVILKMTLQGRSFSLRSPAYLRRILSGGN
jgi:hypothetical protein